MSTTPILGLTKPDPGDLNWDVALNGNFDILDAATPAFEAPGDTKQSSPATETDEFDDTSLDGKWSWDNQGSATAVESDGRLLITCPASASRNWRSLRQTAPSAPFTIITRITFGSESTGTAAHASLILANSSNARFLECGHGMLSTANWKVEFAKYTDNTTQSSAPVVFSNANIYQYVRMDVTSTTVTFSVSLDGVTWQRVATETLTTFLTQVGGAADRIGIGVNSQNSAITYASVYWFRKT